MMSKKKKEDTYYLRVRVTYEDVVEVKATSYVEAAIKAEQSVYDRMNDDVEGHTDIEEWSDEFHH
tara:strand:- start:50 stop:244 length:195 start_codon:yes stop_codon:yes gene_type:complete